LPARQSEVFCLHQLGDWRYQQIADELGMSAGAVGVMLHRTREKLQELLEMHGRLAVELARRRR
jgi:RNA polymerase sigma factor (sigma-70 family)